MKTELCRLLDIHKPIVSAPMGGAAAPDLVAAVSNAGGFGVIPLWGKPVEQVRDGIDQVRADVIVAQGWEAGGHVCGKVATMALVPAVVDAVRVPVVAAGGIADGRGLAAALMLGASGVWIGTRFLASAEAAIHETYRQAVPGASESRAEWFSDLYDVAWPGAPHRALSNSTSEKWRRAGSPGIGARPDENEVIGHLPTGDAVVRYQSHTALPGTTGDVEAMSLWAGQGVSLVKRVLPAADIVEEIYRDAKAAIQSGQEYVPDG